MGVAASARARVVGITTQFKDLGGGAAQLLPQRIAVFGQGNDSEVYSLTKRQVFSSFEVATVYGFGSPLHLSALQLLPLNGDGVGTIPVTIYPLEAAGTAAAAVGSFAITDTATAAGVIKVWINNVPMRDTLVPDGVLGTIIGQEVVNSINATINAPATATFLGTGGLTAKWSGASSNELFMVIDTSGAPGLGSSITQPTGGLVNPGLTSALAQIGNVWETFILNCLNIQDVAALAEFEVYGLGRWGTTVKKPLMILTGNRATTVAAAITVPDARKTDYQNFQSVNPGSNDLGFVTAARDLARIAVVANNNPARDYGSQQLTGLAVGLDEEQWNYLERDTALKGGSSTVEVKNGVVNISDTVTFFHPDGDPNPAYRYVCDVVKLQNIIYNTNLIFDNANWDGAPLIPDDQPTTNKNAKKPKTAKAAIAAMLDSLGLEAIISDPETAKQSIQANISPTNPKRLDVVFTVKLAGNANIISIDLNFGFFFGSAALV